MVIVAIWQLYTSLSGISPLVLPSPVEIASVSIERYDLLLQQTWPTFVETILGFGLALLIGIPLAVFVAFVLFSALSTSTVITMFGYFSRRPDEADHRLAEIKARLARSPQKVYARLAHNL